MSADAVESGAIGAWYNLVILFIAAAHVLLIRILPTHTANGYHK